MGTLQPFKITLIFAVSSCTAIWRPVNISDTVTDCQKNAGHSPFLLFYLCTRLVFQSNRSFSSTKSVLSFRIIEISSKFQKLYDSDVRLHVPELLITVIWFCILKIWVCIATSQSLPGKPFCSRGGITKECVSLRLSASPLSNFAMQQCIKGLRPAHSKNFPCVSLSLAVNKTVLYYCIIADPDYGWRWSWCDYNLCDCETGLCCYRVHTLIIVTGTKVENHHRVTADPLRQMTSLMMWCVVSRSN